MEQLTKFQPTTWRRVVPPPHSRVSRFVGDFITFRYRERRSYERKIVAKNHRVVFDRREISDRLHCLSISLVQGCPFACLSLCLSDRPSAETRLSFFLGSIVSPRTMGRGILRGSEVSVDVISQKCQGRGVVGHGRPLRPDYRASD